MAKVEISKHNGGKNIHVGFLTIDTDSYDCTIEDVGNECIRDLEDMATESTIPEGYEWTGDEVFEVLE